MVIHVSDDDNPEKRYQVGYGRPPKHTRFTKGKSGNPKGRPKPEPDDIDVEHLFIEQLFVPLTVNVNGKPKKRPAWEVVAKRLLAECMKGNLPAIKLYKEFTENFKLISYKKKLKKEEDRRRLADWLLNELPKWEEEARLLNRRSTDPDEKDYPSLCSCRVSSPD
jgi:hypothetical protein